MSKQVRIDKFLWMVRLFKTRSKAAEACRKDRIKVNGKAVKPAYIVNIGDAFEVKFTPIWRSYKALGFPKSRVGAVLLDDYLEEYTATDELDKLKEYQENQRAQMMHTPSRGRPTKKDRREIDKLKGNQND